MLLKSLEIQGFKTFPDKTSLKFEDSMVAVVGPNGSGKSNVSDAIRWVLGEQSTRALRCSKMEDVIFKGTTSRKALGFAEVTMNIDNTDRRLNFDGDQVSITRRYYRSGESEYLINKASVRLKDINELFMDTGLGRDGYSMIGQGKIDSIVAAKSEERREIFEEAAGISRYRYRKEESERRLDRAEENLIRLRDILAELEGRIEPLRVQSEKAQRFIEYDAEKKGLEIGIWVETLNRSGKILREHEEKIAIAESQRIEVEESIQKIERDIEKNFQDTNGFTVKMECLRNEASSLDEEATRTEGEISVLENDISHANQNIKRIMGEIEESSDSGKNLELEIAQKTAEAEAKGRDIDQHNSEYIRLADELENTRKGSDSVSSLIDEETAAVARLSAEVSEERVRYSSAASSVAEIRNRGNSLDSLIEENNADYSGLKEEESELQELLSKTAENIENAANAIEGYAMRLDSRRKKAADIKTELDKSLLDAGEQSRRAKILEDLERNLEGFTQSVKVVMKEAGRGTLGGIHGPVTKLIKTPREYAVAIETALGAAMQNIVVSSEQDAKAAINMLKRRDSGRATFLPLTTIKGYLLDKRNVSAMEGFVGIAAELVECGEQYRGVRDSLLGRTAVAENLDSAVAIAKKAGYKFRIVTLDGQVVNAGGSLTGGSMARNSGLLSRASEIERIREKAAELSKKAEELSARYKKVTGEIGEAEAQLNLAKNELQNFNEEKIKITAELSRVSRDLSQKESSIRNLMAEKESSQGRINELNESMLAIYGRINEYEKKIAQSKEKLESLSGSKQSRMDYCDEISAKLQEIKLFGFAAQKDKESLEAYIEALKERKENSAGVLERLSGQIVEHRKQIESITENINALKSKAAELRAESAEKRNETARISQKREELEKEAAELRRRERELNLRRENTASEAARLSERRENLQNEYDTIISKLWEEYELTRREAEEQAIAIEDMQKSQRRLTELKNKIKALGAVNVAAVVEYQEVSERYTFLKDQIGDVEKSRLELIKLIGELTAKMQEQFSVRFAEINRNFVEIFKELFGGGTAELSFTDENDILNSGIEIKVHPPGKIVSHIEALSGGEKALVAISIYFAIMKVSPPPFCMLDEVEAALDDVNVRRFADYLHRMNRSTQFIVITHRRGTMEAADMLYGVTMQDDGISKLLALKTHEVEEKLGMKNN